MAIDLPLDQMSVAEKLAAIEALWASLRGNPTDVASPEWHGKILADRTQRLESGGTDVSDWTEAKRRLQDLGR